MLSFALSFKYHGQNIDLVLKYLTCPYHFVYFKNTAVCLLLIPRMVLVLTINYVIDIGDNTILEIISKQIATFLKYAIIYNVICVDRGFIPEHLRGENKNLHLEI